MNVLWKKRNNGRLWHQGEALSRNGCEQRGLVAKSEEHGLAGPTCL